MKHIKELNRLNKHGICSVPVAIKDKYPSMLKGWKRFETELPNVDDLQRFQVFYDADKYGICLICGQVSGGLLAIDFDNHLKNADQIFNEYTDIPEVAEIVKRYDLPVETTQSGGYHLLLKCTPTPGNQKLAMQPDGDKFDTVIETRGQGGLIVCAPSKGYELVSGDLYNIATITEDELTILLDYAKSFDMAPEPEKPEPKQPMQTDGERPGDLFNERNDTESLLRGYGWTHIRGKLWRRPGKDTGVSATLGFVAPGVFYNFSGNSYPIEQQKGYDAFRLYAAYEHNNDLSAAARQIAKDYELKPAKRPVKKTEPKPEPTPDDPGVKITTKTTDSENDFDFWYATDRGAIEIDYVRFGQFLQQEGFYRYEINPEKLMPVKINGNIVTEFIPEMLYTYVRKHVLRVADEQVYNKIRKNKAMLNVDDILREMEIIDIEFTQDTHEFTYLYYQNTAVKVSGNGYSIVRYDDLPGKVWQSQIIDREIKITEDIDECDAQKLINALSNGKPDRFLAYTTALGYLLNRNKDPEQCPAIAFGDEIMEDEKAKGGTGKGLTMKMVAKIRNVVIINGKQFDPNKSFTFSRVNQDTDVILIDDLNRKFDLEELFSTITEGVEIEKKYMNQVYVPFQDSPKWAYTHNYPLKGDGDSFDRRRFSIEVFPYFNSRHRPSDSLGRGFFDWPAEEWNRFDNFMLNCAQVYLKYGLKKPVYVHLETNNLKANTTSDFPAWADKTLKEGERYNKRELYEQYVKVTGDYMTKQRYFNQCLKKYAEHKRWKYDFNVGAGGGDIQFFDGNADAGAPF